MRRANSASRMCRREIILVFAWEKVEEGVGYESEFVKAAECQAVKVQVRAKGNEPVDLKLIRRRSEGRFRGVTGLNIWIATGLPAGLPGWWAESPRCAVWLPGTSASWSARCGRYLRKRTAQSADLGSSARRAGLASHGRRARCRRGTHPGCQ